MADTDSRTPGVLLPITAENAGDPTNAVRAWMSQVTGIDQKLVRRRWAPKPGTMPGIGTDWIAVGIDRVETPGTPDEMGRKGLIEQAAGGDMVQVTYQRFHILASFYGPNAAVISDSFRACAQIGQNLDELRNSGLQLIGIEQDVSYVPDLLAEQWVDRFDVFFTVGRSVRRSYGIRDIAAIGGFRIYTDVHLKESK